MISFGKPQQVVHILNKAANIHKNDSEIKNKTLVSLIKNVRQAAPGFDRVSLTRDTTGNSIERLQQYTNPHNVTMPKLQKQGASVLFDMLQRVSHQKERDVQPGNGYVSNADLRELSSSLTKLANTIQTKTGSFTVQNERAKETHALIQAVQQNRATFISSQRHQQNPNVAKAAKLEKLEQQAETIKRQLNSQPYHRLVNHMLKQSDINRFRKAATANLSTISDLQQKINIAKATTLEKSE